MRPMKHGFSRTNNVHPLYRVWLQMRCRCNNPNHKQFKDWGGRGVSVCDDWNDFRFFAGWAISNGWEKGLLIDRVDNDGDYCPENCRFVESAKSICNQRLLKSTNTSGYRGVSFYKRTKMWQSRININGKKKHLGYFVSARLAALRYDVEAFILSDGRPLNFIT